MLNPLASEGIGARAERHQRIEVRGVRDILEQVDRGKYTRDELYRLLPPQPLRCQPRAFIRRRQWKSPASRCGEVREGLVQPDHTGTHHLHW
jgi:hypothetical protein